MADLFHTFSSKHQPNHWITPSFLIFSCLSTYHPCYDCIICYSFVSSIQNQNFFSRFLLVFVQVSTWTCRGAQITLEELEFWITETVSPYQHKEPPKVRGTRLIVVAGMFPYNFSTIICVYFFLEQWNLVKTHIFKLPKNTQLPPAS